MTVNLTNLLEATNAATTTDKTGVTMGNWEFGIMIFFVIVGVALIAALVTFFVAKKFFEKQIKENPPVTEKMIRVMFQQMGRKASETQIRQIMRSMQNAKGDKK
ncbi:YneF family protein [Mycoplasma hafezii]|uniref:YneF family protein n=1 Tax=Mycoplasma hafezii TaxID=525886 RepID=UPI003CECBB78